jgi:DNA-binding NarL/FixJ family response regulator
MDGIAATNEIKARTSEVEVVALTSVLDDGAVTGRCVPELWVIS